MNTSTGESVADRLKPKYIQDVKPNYSITNMLFNKNTVSASLNLNSYEPYNSQRIICLYPNERYTVNNLRQSQNVNEMLRVLPLEPKQINSIHDTRARSYKRPVTSKIKSQQHTKRSLNY